MPHPTLDLLRSNKSLQRRWPLVLKFETLARTYKALAQTKRSAKLVCLSGFRWEQQRDVCLRLLVSLATLQLCPVLWDARQ